MLTKPDFTKLARAPEILVSGTYYDALCPDFAFAITLKPMGPFTDSTHLVALIGELTDQYITGKWDEAAEKFIPQVLLTPDLQHIVVDEGTIKAVSQLLVQQSAVDAQGEPSPIYDVFELFRIQHRAAQAFNDAVLAAYHVSDGLREKKGATRQPSLPDSFISPESAAPSITEASIPAS